MPIPKIITEIGTGMAIGAWNDHRQLQQNEKMLQQQLKANQAMSIFQQKQQLEMWEKTGYGATKDQMKRAGLNPALMYGTGGGAGGTTGGTQAGTVSAGSAPGGGGEIMGMMQLRAQKAQIELLEAQAKKTDVEANKIENVDTPNVQADTENKVLNSVVLKYLGKEAEAQWKINEHNRPAEGEAKWLELEARIGTAQSIIELAGKGALTEKALAELEQTHLSNAKSRAEKRNIDKTFEILEEQLKSGKLQNAITEIELQLQKQTGLDKGSAGWLKVIGRIFGNYIEAAANTIR